MSRADRKNTGRRGRKNTTEVKRKARQRRINIAERDEELRLRAAIRARVEPWMVRLCGRSVVGLVTRSPVDLLPTNPILYCSEGRVTHFRYRINSSTGRIHTDDPTSIEVTGVQPWSEMSSSHLKALMRRRWHPLWPKNILQIIVNELNEKAPPRS